MRTKPYKVDSTKGKSVIDPVSYKNDALVQVWVDSRLLATLMAWLDLQGVTPTTMADVVRRPLEVMCKFLVDNDDVKMVDDTKMARDMLEKRTGVDLSRGGKGGKNTLHNIVLDARRSDLAEQLKRQGVDVSVPRVDGPIHQGPKGFDMEKALRIFEGGSDDTDSETVE